MFIDCFPSHFYVFWNLKMGNELQKIIFSEIDNGN